MNQASYPGALVLSDLPLAGQLALAKHPDMIIREALASSGSTQPCVLDELLTEYSPAADLANRFAATRTTRIEMLEEMWDEPTIVMRCCRPYLARNPLLPTEMLVEALSDTSTRVALRAYTNPATPEQERHLLSPRRAEEIVGDGSGFGNSIEFLSMKANELVAANLWMLDESKRWGQRIQQVIAWQPEASRATLTKLSRTYKGDHTQIKAHPAFNGTDIHSLSVKQLLATNSMAATAAAIQRPEFTVANATRILRAVAMPEPHIICDLVRRFGLNTLLRKTRQCQVWMSPQCMAAGRLTFALGYVHGSGTAQDYETANEIVAVLQDNSQHWESFVRLLPDWHGDILEAAKTACKL